jgi:DNA-binding NarL/FixJ family response regulator
MRRPHTRLTRREREVVAAILDGCTTNKALSRRFQLSHSTIAKHLFNIYRKKGIHGRTDLAVVAIRDQWLGSDNGRKDN